MTVKEHWKQHQKHTHNLGSNLGRTAVGSSPATPPRTVTEARESITAAIEQNVRPLKEKIKGEILGQMRAIREGMAA